jgi:hypothetical protein
VIALAASFGTADQFLGARAFVLGSWATDVSLLSAPWLLIAFVAGWTQTSTMRAVATGFGCTVAALVGYSAMTLSPLEGAVVSTTEVRGLLVGQAVYAAGGFLTGPLFGWLGYRWRAGERTSALAAASAFACEPLAHAAVGTPVSLRGVWPAEVVVGLLMAVCFIVAGRRAVE